MAEFAIPSAVTLLQAQIEKHNAMGQRFPEKLNGDTQRSKDTQRGGVRSSTDEFFRSARAAPNERVRLSVRAHPNASHRNDLPLDLRDENAEASSPSKEAGKSPNRSLDGGASGLNQASVSGKSGVVNKEESNRFRMGVPQRVEPPKDLNTPVRVEDGTMVSPAEQGDTAAAADSAGVNRRQASVTKLKDQEILAFACRRANKTRSEALAYYNMGVLHDNDKEYDKANGCYDQYLKAARSAGDAKGEQLALNSMGINYFKIGDHAAAIETHNQHLQMADVAGKFVAHTNLGLSYGALDELEKASINHRQALRYAIVMSSLVGESLACGNLGQIAWRKSDAKTAKACMERHLKLAAALKDAKAQLDASEILGILANDSGQFAEAASYFQQSRVLALDTSNSKSAAMAKCKIGMAKGNAQFEDYIANVVAEMDAQDQDDGD